MLTITDATPMMADVISGHCPRPRERRRNESPYRWLEQTPAWRSLTADGTEPTAAHLAAFPLPADVLTGFPVTFWLTWPEREPQLLAVNEDGTRYALLTPDSEWGAEAAQLASRARPGSGRPAANGARRDTRTANQIERTTRKLLTAWALADKPPLAEWLTARLAELPPDVATLRTPEQWQTAIERRAGIVRTIPCPDCTHASGQIDGET